MLLTSRLFTQNRIEWLVPIGNYDRIQHWEKHFLVRENKLWGVLNDRKKLVVEPRFKMVSILNSRAFAALENDKWGIFHSNNLKKWAIEPRYSSIQATSHIMYDETQIRKGIRDDGFDEIKIQDKNVRILAFVRNESIHERMEAIDPVKEEQIAVPKPDPQPWHNQWNSVEFMYNDYYDQNRRRSKIPHRDVYKVTDHQGWTGLTDSTGRILIAPRYAEISIIRINTVAVKEPDGYTFYRLSDGKRMSKGVYFDFLRPAESDSHAIMVWNKMQPTNGNSFGLLSPEGEELIPCTYENMMHPPRFDYTSVKKAGKWGIINMKNEVLVPFEYDRIMYGHIQLRDIFVEKNGKMGLLQLKPEK